MEGKLGGHILGIFIWSSIEKNSIKFIVSSLSIGILILSGLQLNLQECSILVLSLHNSGTDKELYKESEEWELTEKEDLSKESEGWEQIEEELDETSSVLSIDNDIVQESLFEVVDELFFENIKTNSMALSLQ